jgi:hypothetical protein
MMTDRVGDERMPRATCAPVSIVDAVGRVRPARTKRALDRYHEPTHESRRNMTEPQPAPNSGVNVLAIAALVVGAVSIFFNPYLLVSVIAIVLGVIGMVRANRTADQRTYRLIAILGIVAGAAGAVFVIVSNTITASV